MLKKVISVSFLRHAFATSAPEILQVFFKLLIGMVTAKVLGPGKLGIAGATGMVMAYGVLLQGGALDGLGLKVPFLIGQKKEIEAIEYINSGGTGIIGSLLLIFPFLLGGAFIFSSTPLIRNGIIANGIGLILFEFYQLSEAKSRLFFRFRSVFFSRLSFVISNFIFTVTGAYFWGLNGLYVALMAVYLPPVFYLAVIKKERLQVRFNFDKYKELIYLGFPLLLAGSIYTLFITVDRWFIIGKFGPEKLGYYSIMVTLSGMVLLVPIKLVSLLTQYLREAFGKGSSEENLWATTLSFLLICLLIFIPLIAVAGDTAFLLFRYYLPKYYKTVELVRILLNSVFFSCIFNISSIFLVVTNRKKYLILTQVLALLCSIILNYFAIWYHLELKGIATATMLSNFLLSVFTFIFIWKVGVQVKMLCIEKVLAVICLGIGFTWGIDVLFPLTWEMESSQYLVTIGIHVCISALVLAGSVLFIYYRKSYVPLLKVLNREI